MRRVQFYGVLAVLVWIPALEELLLLLPYPPRVTGWLASERFGASSRPLDALLSLALA